jgi:cell division protein FtsZ
MDRYQIFHSDGLGSVSPTSTFSGVATSGITPMVTLPIGKNRDTADEIKTASNYPKIGMVSIGGIGGACLPRVGDYIQNLPYLDRIIAIETSSRELSSLSADHKILLGDGKTPFNPNEGYRLTHLARHEIADAFSGLDMVLLIAGMGGNTGTEIARIIARMLLQQGIFTLSFAIMPFDGEGLQRQKIAEAGIQELQLRSNALISVFNNDMNPQKETIRWLSTAAQRAPLASIQLCRSITNSVARCDLVGIDFKELQHVILGQEGHCAFGFGSACGLDAATDAAQSAIDDPLLGQHRLQQASTALVTIEAPPQATMAVLRDAKNVMNYVRSQMSPSTHIIYGVTANLDDSDKFTVSILASGIHGV